MLYYYFINNTFFYNTKVNPAGTPDWRTTVVINKYNIVYHFNFLI